MLNQIRLAESDKEPICEQPLWIVYLMRLFFFTFMFATPLTINIVYVLTKGALRSDELATVHQVFLWGGLLFSTTTANAAWWLAAASLFSTARTTS